MGVKLDLSHIKSRRLKVSENRVLRGTFGRKREAGENCIMRSFITSTLHPILLG
jgi:hypothetical protein